MEARSVAGVGPLAPVPARSAIGIVTAGAVGAAFAFAVAVAAGVPAPTLSALFTASVIVVAPLGWWARARATGEVRVLLHFLAVAATLWLVGSIDWYVAYVVSGHRVRSAGPWNVPFMLAYVLAMIGLCRALRHAIAVRRAALDASVVTAASIAIAAALAGHAFATGIDTRSLIAVAQVLAGIAVLVLLASAAVGDWNGLPLSVVLFGLGQLSLTIGHAVYGYNAIASQSVELRWSELCWFGGTMLLLLAASVIITRADRPVRMRHGRTRVDGAPTTMYAVFAALSVTAAVAVYGHLSGQITVLAIGLTASAWIGGAAALRTSGALREVAAANGRLRELDELKDELLSSVSHDMRTPLLSICGFVELLRDVADDDEQRGFLTAVDRNSRRMLHMVDDLLLAAKVQSSGLELELAPTDLARIARECVESLQPLARARGVALELGELAGVLVRADARRVAQALDNIAANALKFTPPGGVVTIAVRAHDGVVGLEVRDSGIGIAEADRGHVFERFFRAGGTRTAPGIGLGLYLVDAIAREHGGAVSIASRPKQGTTVVFALPADQPARYR